MEPTGKGDKRVWVAPAAPAGISSRERARRARRSRLTASLPAVATPAHVPSRATPAVDTGPQPTSPATSLPASLTMPVGQVLRVMFVALFLGVIFSARGIVHAGHGMDDGVERTVTLDLGGAVLWVTDGLRLTWPWDRVQDALGRSNETQEAPLLASANRPTTQGNTIRARSGEGTQRPGRPAVAQVVIHPLRLPTAKRPLRLLVTGDSLTEYLAPQIVNAATNDWPVVGFVDTHYGTGLVRPDFVDWSVIAHQQVASDNPDAVVMLLGGNDFQNMTMPGNTILQAGSAAWVREYQRRATVVMRIWTRNGTRRVYWLSIPPAYTSAWGKIDVQINSAVQRAAAQVPGARFVNVLGPVTDHGRYTWTVTTQEGRTVVVRTPDGIHLTQEGSDMVARAVLPVIGREWKLSITRHAPSN